jgi:ribokinase
VVTLVDAEGENASVAYDGANNAMMPADIDAAEEAFADAKVCLIHGRLPKDAVAKAIMAAKLHNLKVILDPAGAICPASVEGEHTLPAEYFSADVLIPNLYEAALITEHSTGNIRDAKLIGSDLIARGIGAVVITMGKRGCMLVDRNGADHIAAYAIDLVDPTGTGDAFAGALAASCGAGDELRTAVKFASAAGALACTKFGAVESMPAKAEIIELLQKQEGE